MIKTVSTLLTFTDYSGLKADAVLFGNGTLVSRNPNTVSFVGKYVWSADLSRDAALAMNAGKYGWKFDASLDYEFDSAGNVNFNSSANVDVRLGSQLASEKGVFQLDTEVVDGVWRPKQRVFSAVTDARRIVRAELPAWFVFFVVKRLDRKQN